MILASLGVSAEATRAVLSALLAQGLHDSTREAQIIDGKAIAAEWRAEVAAWSKRLKDERGITPGLALVLVGDNPSSLSYIRSKGDSAEQAGLYSDVFHFPESTDEQRIISHVLDLNSDPRFHGILVQLPLPKHMSESNVSDAIDPTKDADAVTAVSQGRLLRGEPSPWPATPNGIVELLHRSGHPPAGKHVVVCGRSNIVGKPIAAILMQKSEKANATVTMCHTGTPDIGVYTRQADILIAAMGVANAITGDMIKPGAVVIDVGNNWIEDASRKTGRRLVGDVDYESALAVAGAITPVPGGVGPMTIAGLLSNTCWLAERYGQR
jgi:methylenetetrahydrofolate dehydrogenase (NADP+)/methenyltetrahydrofolate cyclohydrolase